MNRTHASFLAAITTLTLASTGLFGTAVSSATPFPGEVNAGGLRLVASVDSNNWLLAGDTALGVPFSHAAKVSGNFSTTLQGARIRSGQVVAGYLVGCAVDVSDGIGISITPEIGAGYDVSPTIGADAGIDFALNMDAPPDVVIGFGAGVDLTQTFGVEGALSGELSVGLAPGTVTALPVGTATLDAESTFPFVFAHTSTPLHVNGCLSPASAMPFISVRAETYGGTVQTTGYGDAFTF
ncbi:MspA family porin [Nocardia higoensis]|uniref:MspA family porin n=1 Tax=Nocardia higoensis TaxID=228599 RepID=UPI0002E18F4A|nr:MspA family porin [Nocardia higoensis]